MSDSDTILYLFRTGFLGRVKSPGLRRNTKAVAEDYDKNRGSLLFFNISRYPTFDLSNTNERTNWFNIHVKAAFDPLGDSL